MTATATALVVDNVAISDMTSKSGGILEEARNLRIVTADDYALAAEIGKSLKALVREAEETFDPIIATWNKGHKQTLAAKASFVTPLEGGITRIKKLMIDWKRVQDERQRDEDRRRIDAARKLEEERRLQEAIEIEEEHGTSAAVAILDEPIVYIPFVPTQAVKSTPVVSGVANTERWTFNRETVDLMALVCYVAGVEKLAHPDMLCVLAPDLKSIGGLVTAQKGFFNLPGISAYKEDGVSLRSGR